MMTTHARCLILTIVSTTFLSTTTFAADPPTSDPRTPIATVFSKPIYADELESSPSAQLPAGLTDEQRSQWQASQRNERLSQMISTPLVAQFCQTHACEPTDEEITAFNQSVGRSRQQRLQEWKSQHASLTAELQAPNVSEARRTEATKELQQVDSLLATEEHMYDGMTPEQRAAVEASRPAREKEIAGVFIRAWKFNKALYQQYGGRVIFQQAGMEPLDAYRAWLQEHERNGDFAINDPDMHQRFWSYFVSEGHNFVPIESFRQESGMADPWEKPWWLVEPKKTP